jgi:hypothetical protein
VSREPAIYEGFLCFAGTLNLTKELQFFPRAPLDKGIFRLFSFLELPKKKSWKNDWPYHIHSEFCSTSIFLKSDLRAAMVSALSTVRRFMLLFATTVFPVAESYEER